jgi:uncharacterized protein (DUF1778 family)
VSDEPRSARLNLRLTSSKLEIWRKYAEAEGRTLTAFVELAVDGYIDLVKAVRRADDIADRRAKRLGQLSPTRIEELRRRGGDVSNWPELDD